MNSRIRRHDYLVNLLQMIAETLFFYQPAIWWVSSRIRGERELCCDDMVVVSTTGRAGVRNWGKSSLSR
jgi:beta-lactamase regulating signal transducer with metallopeptidase domain